MDRASFVSRAQTLLDQGAYESVLEEVRRWLDQNPGDVDALIVQCHACMRLGKLEAATALIEDVEMTVLGLSRVYASMGDICSKGGLNQEAVKFYHRFLALNPGSDLSLDVAGKLRILEDDLQNLIQGSTIQDAVPAPPLIAGFQTLTMVDLYLRQGHLDAAEALLEQMAIKDPENTAIKEKRMDVRASLRMQEEEATRRQRRKKVVGTLNQWLNGLQRKRLYAF